MESHESSSFILLLLTKNRFIFNTHVPSVAIVLGFSAKVPELVNLDAVAKDRIPLIRRYTGGGTVVVDKSTGKRMQCTNVQCSYRLFHLWLSTLTCFYSILYHVTTVFTTFIMNDADVPSKPYPREIMTWSETDIFGPVFRSNNCHTAAERDENHQVW